jgi:two-component system, chemotaxis family, chemotaxis protein CheY
MAKTVLIVDDIAFVRNTLNEILTQAHYQVVGEAKDGGEAIALYQKLKPDVVTMDVVMPHMGGIDAARKILKMDRNAKIIIISAMGQETLVMEAINVGIKDYILKPFTPDDIIKSVERALYGGQQILNRSSQRDKTS